MPALLGFLMVYLAWVSVGAVTLVVSRWALPLAKAMAVVVFWPLVAVYVADRRLRGVRDGLPRARMVVR